MHLEIKFYGQKTTVVGEQKMEPRYLSVYTHQNKT